jgi:hypothetical protein
VSWLLVAFIPALLMLATFGLERLESRLGCEAVGAADVVDFLAHAEPVDVSTLARDGMAEALDCLQRRRMGHIGPSQEVANYSRGVRALANPQFRQTRHADSV